MLSHDLRKYLLGLRLKHYDFLFVFGFLGFFTVYALTSSFVAAITLAVLSWILSIVCYVIYYFELGDVSGYIKDAKRKPNLPLRQRLLSWLMLFVILLFGFAGAIAFILLVIYLFGNNGILIGLGAAVGAVLGLNVFMVLKNFFPR